MKKILAGCGVIGFPLLLLSQNYLTPDKLYGPLFTEVQLQRLFPDGKTFVDMNPKRDPAEIMRDYQRMKGPTFELKKFVEQNFELPRTPQLNYFREEKNIVMHITNLWNVLTREPDAYAKGSSLLPLPYTYVVPGGRFREVYYWDSYFTMLGLKESGRADLIESMVRNFAYLIDSFGHVPNGNRTYYLSRSQPPFFALMVELLAGIKGDSLYAHFLPQLEKEYAYWMENPGTLKPGMAYKRVVMPDKQTLLNRYWDDAAIPRQESYREDVETARQSSGNKAEVYRHLRAGAASGWDFSSRWLQDPRKLASIETGNYIPVDLNSLLYKLEKVIAHAHILKGDAAAAESFLQKAELRRIAIDRYCWNPTLRFYTDYQFRKKIKSNLVTPAGMYPFCFFEGRDDYLSLLARQAAESIRSKLLQPGGVRATPASTGQQWDAPNGWAPLQWMTIWGLDRCGQRELAREIAKRWIQLNIDVYQRTGKLMEKYNVQDLSLEAGGGEYASQDGFGWTNGVFLALVHKYALEKTIPR